MNDNDNYKMIIEQYKNIRDNDIRMLVENTTDFGVLHGLEDKSIATGLLKRAALDLANPANESTLSGDIAPFIANLLPMIRRTMPNLVAPHLLGVQQMTQPQHWIYALVNSYTGDGTRTDSDPLKIVKITAGDTTALEVFYNEGDLYLVKQDADLTGLTVTETYSNEAAFGRIFKNYSGPHSTADAEKLAKNMKEVGIKVVRKTVETTSRKLKSQYSIEMYEDLKNQHGVLADEQIMSLMSYELQAEIDRECVDFVNSNATQLPDAQKMSFSGSYDTGGRWEIEKYRVNVIKISKEAVNIGLDTKQGAGNTLLVSPKVATMLDQVSRFSLATQSNNSNPFTIGGYAGVFDNRFNVVIDQYAGSSDYCTVVYRGATNTDAMGFYAPYQAAFFTKLMTPDSAQPLVVLNTRYALATIPGISSGDSNDRAKTYARSFGVDFTNTILA